MGRRCRPQANHRQRLQPRQCDLRQPPALHQHATTLGSALTKQWDCARGRRVSGRRRCSDGMDRQRSEQIALFRFSVVAEATKPTADADPARPGDAQAGHPKLRGPRRAVPRLLPGNPGPLGGRLPLQGSCGPGATPPIRCRQAQRPGRMAGRGGTPAQGAADPLVGGHCRRHWPDPQGVALGAHGAGPPGEGGPEQGGAVLRARQGLRALPGATAQRAVVRRRVPRALRPPTPGWRAAAGLGCSACWTITAA